MSKHRILSKNHITCPACGTASTNYFTTETQDENGVSEISVLFRCASCGGLYTDSQRPISREAALKFVNLNEMTDHDVDAYHLAYFDFDIRNPKGGYYRTHGWFDNVSMKVAQFG